MAKKTVNQNTITYSGRRMAATLGLLSEITAWTVQQNTITYSDVISTYTKVANGSLHSHHLQLRNRA